MVNKNPENHESYGVIVISRSQGSEIPLFGSSIMHSTVINLRIHEATKYRDLNRDWIHPGKQLVDIEMSPEQFANAITGIGIGGGTPITIKYIRGDEKNRETPPRPMVHQHFKRELNESTNDIIHQIDDLIESSKGSMRKKLEALKRSLESTLPFIHLQLQRQMDKTVSEAKAEVDAFVMEKLTSIGLDTIHEQMALMSHVDEIEDEDIIDVQ